MASKNTRHPEEAAKRLSRRTHGADPATWMSSDAAFEADRQQLLRFDRELHRQFLQDVLAEAVDDQRERVLVLDAALAAIEQLVVEIFEVVASCSIRAEGLRTSI